MNKILLTAQSAIVLLGIALMCTGTSAHAQQNPKKLQRQNRKEAAQGKKQNPTHVKLVYTQSTEAGLNELKQLTKSDPERHSQAMARYDALIAEGKIILSTLEYAPIRERINKAKSNNNPSDSEDVERAVYAKNAEKKYIVVTELIR